jgi:uncharacterized protein (TIGR02996 family)
VVGQPDDDELRAVLADALQAAGDPRGELIALQLMPTDDAQAPARRDRIQALLAEHAARWLGALAPIVRSAHFDRGLLDRFDLREAWRSSDPRWDAVLSDPALATVEQVRPSMRRSGGEPGTIYEWLLRAPELLRLRRVEIQYRDLLDALDDRVEHVACAASIPTRELVAALERLPRITSLTIAASEAGKIASTPCFRRMRHVTLAGPVRQGLELWPRMPEGTTLAVVPNPELPRCRRTYPWDYRVELASAEAGLVARVSGEWLLTAVDALAALPDRVARIEIEHTSDMIAERVRAFAEARGIPVTVRRATWHGNATIHEDDR